jgi:hypothetical protein
MEQTPAASSPAETPDVFNGQQPSLSEFSEYRETGKAPERFKPAEKAESAPADAPESTVDAEEKSQEPPQKGAEKRIKQLLAEKKQAIAEKEDLQRRLDAAKPGVTADPPPVQAKPPAEPAIEDQNPDGTQKYKTYEDFVKAQARWEAKQEFAEQQQALEARQTQQKALESLQTKLDDARSRYDDADQVIFPAAEQIRTAHIPLAIKEVIAGSDVFPDLCYVLGEDSAEFKKFISLAQANPRAALATVFEYEKGIREQFRKPEPDGGVAPARKTAAPKPAVPVAGGGSRAFDVSDESLSPEEWARKRTADLKRRGKG